LLGCTKSQSRIVTKSIAKSLAIVVALVAVSFQACSSFNEKEVSTLGKAKIFQRAYEAMDAGDYDGALRYYDAFRQIFPNDLSGNLWASYEVAFIYHKMGNNALAVKLFEELLAKYKNEGTPSWPQAQKILAERIVKDLQKNLKPKDTGSDSKTAPEEKK
jgi:tetratricopeptide (TPR) repeat protein